MMGQKQWQVRQAYSGCSLLLHSVDRKNGGRKGERKEDKEVGREKEGEWESFIFLLISELMAG